MEPSGSEIERAGDALYQAYGLVQNAASATNMPSAGGFRQNVMQGLRAAAVYVAEGDGAMTLREDKLIQQIFWLDKDGLTNTQLSQALAQQPDLGTRALDFLGQLASVLISFDELMGHAAGQSPNEALDAFELVFQTVMAGDGSEEPEVERLNAVMERLRKDVPAAPKLPQTAVEGDAVSMGGVVSEDALRAILRELDQLVGLADVKREVETLTNLAKVFEIRRRMGLPVPDMSFHLVFLGNPGTGKTTVARIVAKIYGALGLLSKGHLIEVDRSGLIANYVGQTATKVQEVVDKAMGGVLFIDEAYALDQGGETDFGQEAVATLLKAMEDHRSDLVVIAAGYTDEMHRFLDMNPGLRSRMSRDLLFADYSPDEMVQILEGMAGAAQYRLPPDCKSMLLASFKDMWSGRGKDFANARDVRNLFERLIDAQANRVGCLAQPCQDDVVTITAADIAAACELPPQAAAA